MSSFSSRAGWEDVIPIPQDDGPSPVASIAYPPLYVELMDLFRAVLVSEEKSGRVMDLTRELLSLNAGNYTAWQYRRDCLRVLPDYLAQELDYLDTFSDDNPKNYQIWYHRRAVVEMIGNPDREKQFCERVFQVDAKNYHAWSHRQWVVKTFDLWEGEFECIDLLLTDDVRNNSAWNHRWFIVHGRGNAPPSDATIEAEYHYAWKSIDSVSLNESAWNYLRGLCRTHPQLASPTKVRCYALLSLGSSTLSLDDSNSAASTVPGTEDLDDSDDVDWEDSEDRPLWSNPFALSLLADLSLLESQASSCLDAARCYVLLQKFDAIRIKMWARKEAAARLAAIQLSESDASA